MFELIKEVKIVVRISKNWSGIMKKEKSCGCVVFNNKREVLVVQMNYGHWSFPKGHVEPSETEIETALRETFEETNVKCNILHNFREVSSYSPKPQVI